MLKNNRRSVLKYYAKEIGFPVKALVASNFPSVYLHRWLPVLSMTIKELEFPFNPPSNISYIGAMVDESRNGGKSYPHVPGDLLEILEAGKRKGAKIIYCSLTTMKEGGDAQFIQKVIQAVGNQPGWIMIVSKGTNLMVDPSGTLPSNIHLFDWVPQLAVLRMADCSINHGGIHTIHECLHFRVPMIIYSGKRYDQNGNAARIAYRGLGIIGDKDKDDSQTIRDKIKKVLHAQEIKYNMAKYHDLYLAYRKDALTPKL